MIARTTGRFLQLGLDIGRARFSLGRMLGALLVCGLLVGSTSEGSAGAQEENLENMPWYDAENSEAKAIPLRPLRTSKANHRDSDWIHVDKAQNWNLPQGSGSGGANRIGPGALPRFLGQLVTWIIWILVGVICLALLGWIIWLLVKQEWRSKPNFNAGDWDKRPEIDPARIEALPFEINTGQADMLGLARQAQAEGRLRDAIIYLYSYMLLKLDKHHWIRLAKGKTNRTYLREIRAEQDLHSLLHRTVVTFEDVFFGNLALEKEEFQSRWNELDQFHRIVEARRT